MIRRLLLLIAFVGLTSSTISRAQSWYGKVGDVVALQTQAEAGDGDAIAELAWYQLFSLGGLRYDSIEVPAAFRSAAEKGSAIGKAGLALVLWNETRWTDWKANAWPHAKEALEAKPDHPLIKSVAGLFYQFGRGAEKDEAKALQLYREAWEAGCPLGGYRLLLCHKWGEAGLEKDLSKYAELARELSSRYQFAQAASELLDDVEQDRSEESVAMAAKLRRVISAAAMRGDPNAQFRMAWVFRRNGDWETALRFYELAARNDHRVATSNLISRFTMRPDNPNMLRSGDGTIHRLARRSYERNGADSGMHRLAARDYRDGIGGGDKKFTRSERIFLEQLDNGVCAMHSELGFLYCCDLKGKPDKLHRVELGIAHLLAHSHHGSSSAGHLAGVYAGDYTDDIPVDLPKAYASATRAREKVKGPWTDARFNKLAERLDEAQMAEAEALMEDGFPHDIKHRQPAIDLLVKEGQWEAGRELR